MSERSCIPREAMPQVRDPWLLASALARSAVPFQFIDLHTAELRGRQVVSRVRVREMEADKVTKWPLVVSVEPLIIDGNHRWFWAHFHRAPRLLTCLQLMEDFETALSRVRFALAQHPEIALKVEE